MKIAFLHFGTFRWIRGIETLIMSLSNNLVKKGVDVSILSACPTKNKFTFELDSRVKVKHFPTFHYFEYQTIVPFYAMDLIKNKYDIVNIFFADYGENISIKLASQFNDFYLNLYITYSLEVTRHRFEAFKRYGLVDRADSIISDCEYVASGAEQFFKRPSVVIPIGSDPELFKPNAIARNQIRHRFRIMDDEVVLLNVSSLEPRKGIWRVIDALPEIKKRYSKIRYLILGDGVGRKDLEKKVKLLGLDGCVIFIGTTTILNNFYSASDIFIMLADNECNSIACHEAMLCQLPVIVPNNGGLPEHVDDTCGKLVNINCQESIVSSVVSLASNKKLRDQLGHKARKKIKENLTWENSANTLLEHFKNQCKEI